MSEPHIHLGPAPPRAASLHPAILISGVPDSGKRTLAKALLRLPSECPPSHRVLTIRTRETLLLRSSTTPTHPTTHPPVSEADFLLLIVDATRPAGLGELRETLARLPVEWWEALVVVVTKALLPRDDGAPDPPARSRLHGWESGSDAESRPV